MIRLKAGVSIAALRPQMLVVLQVADAVYAKHGVDCVVTSGDEGTHSRGSRHYSGDAVDLRTRTLGAGDRSQVRFELAEALGDAFDVVLEGTHIHVEYQPKGGANQ